MMMMNMMGMEMMRMMLECMMMMTSIVAEMMTMPAKMVSSVKRTTSLSLVMAGAFLLMMDWNWFMKMTNGNRNWRNKLHWINVAYQNIPQGLSVLNKEDIIERILHSYRPHILGLAEPRYSELSTMFFDGYSLVSGSALGINDPRLNILVKDGLTLEFLPFETEIPSILVKVGQAKVLFLYREWNKDGDEDTGSFTQQEDRWREFVRRWRTLKGRVNVVGDCNFEYWKLETAHHRNCQKIKAEVTDNIIPRGYVQCILEDTRTQGSQKSCIDHLYSNNAQFVDRIINKSVSAYDHNMIMFRMTLHQPVFQPHTTYLRDVKTLNPAHFQLIFQELDHSDFLLETDVDNQVKILANKVTSVLDIVAPVRKIKIKKRHAKYLTRELILQIKERDKMRKQAVRTGLEADWTRFKVFRNQVRKQLKVAKRQYLSDKILQSDSKEMWRVLKETSGLQAKESGQIQLKIGDKLVREPALVAEELSRYYVDKVTKIVQEHPPNPQLAKVYTERYLRGKTISSLDFQHVTVADVVKIISDLKNTGATGEDGISVTLLKKLSFSLSFFIMVVVNNCINQSKYPQSFKHGIITPVPKPGDPTDKKSWRPVTILDAMSKVVEKVLNQQLRDHLVKNNLISPEQHAYQDRKSVMTAWTEIDTITVSGLDRRKLVGYQLQDMSAAFNLVDKDILKPKLKMLGCSEYVIKLIDSYMTGRTNSVKVQGYVSPAVQVETGVGEGSVLGPLIFLICILEVSCVMEIVREIMEEKHRDINDDVELHTVQFADDCTNVVGTEDEWQMEVAMELCSVEYHKYFSANGMKLNLAKEEHVIHAHSAVKRVKPGGVVVDGREEASKVKLLGIVVESNYRFSAHTSNLISKSNQRLAHIAKVRGMVPEKQLRMMMDALVFSVLSWGLELAGRDLVNLKRLQIVQNVGMRILTNSEMEMSIRIMIQRLKLLNMRNLARLRWMTQIRRVINQKSCPKTLQFIVMPRADSRTKVMRTTFPSNLIRQSGKALLINGLKLLNDSNWLKDKVGDQDDAFKNLARKFLLESYDNGKL